MQLFNFVKGQSKQHEKHKKHQKMQGASTLFPEGNHAVVSEDITPHQLGRIYYQSTYWFACAIHDTYIPEGTIVEVLERRATTWLVRPVASTVSNGYSCSDLN